MQNEKIIFLGVGKGIVNALRRIVRSNIHGVGFAFTSMTDYVVDYYVDVPIKFHVQNFNDCEKIVKEKFSDTDIIFVFVCANEADELSLASKFAQEAKAAGILTIGLVIISGGFNDFAKFTGSFKSPYDTVFFLHSYSCSRCETYQKIIECISDLINKSGFINLDLADVKTILRNSGEGKFGKSYFGGCNRALNAATEAVHNVSLISERVFGGKKFFDDNFV